MLVEKFFPTSPHTFVIYSPTSNILYLDPHSQWKTALCDFRNPLTLDLEQFRHFESIIDFASMTKSYQGSGANAKIRQLDP